MNFSDILRSPGAVREQYLEVLVPVASFGCTFVGILLWQAGIRIDFQFFAAGCVVSSCILAYLAFIHPRKDIVALSTPLYAIIFFVVPTEYAAGAVLQLLYSASLTFLLIRLKTRFGSAAPASGTPFPQDSLAQYAQRLDKALPAIPSRIAGRAGMVFARFAQGEYGLARQLALPVPDAGDEIPDPLMQAFLIVAEHAGQMVSGTAEPDNYQHFPPEQCALLFHQQPAGTASVQEYHVTLDNALILLYAVALNNRSAGTDEKLIIDGFRPFACKLCGE